ncbi:MAG: efflux RND transporter permease subunit [Calditrichaeota bacterium]|nr:efflux RND transporter permease subunit [Calditrichota bacterium]HQU71265.1 CusA/CzcA family heavy metal efflux RND transporter [Calditrichia bacterium]
MNSIIRFAIDKRLLTVCFGLLILAAGAVAYRQLPVDAFPDVSPTLVQVFTVTEGLAPEEVEKFVTYPVEAAMNGLPDLKMLRSVSNFGLSVVNIYFEDGIDIFFARQLVGERLAEAREKIPEGFGSPRMGPISTGMGLVMFYYLEDSTGSYSLTELRTLQDWVVKFHLQTVPGVTEVLGIGGWEKQYQVAVDPRALQRYRVDLNHLVETIRNNNLNVGAQFIEKGAEEFVVRSVGLATGIGDLENIVVKTNRGTPVYLRQVAEVRSGGAIRRGSQTRNGKTEVVSGMVVKLFGSNASTVIGRVEEKVAEINGILPPGVRIVPYYEQKTLVEACIATVSEALILGIILVIAILFVFMGSLRPSMVVALSIPFSILFALLGMHYFNISANLMSFGGLAIAIGMLVDGTIVIVENIDHRLRQMPPGQSHLGTIVPAVAEVIRPVVFAILIIIVVFLPLFTLSGVEGKTFSPLAFSVALAMLGSLVFAVVLAPALAAYLMKKKKRTAPAWERHFEGAIRGVYAPLVTFMVHRRGLAIFLALLLLSTGLFIFPRLGSEFTPTLREGTIVLRLTMAPSISLTESTRIAGIVERRLMRIREVDGVVSRIGRGEVGAHADPVNSAEMFIRLAPEAQWRGSGDQAALETLIRQELGEIPGALVNFTQPIQMSVDELLEGVRAELAVKLFGDDLGVLREKADQIADILSGISGARDIQVDQVAGMPQLVARINRQAIARYGINVSEVQQTIRTAIGGITAGQVFEGIRHFDILVRYAAEARDRAAAIGNLLIRGPDGISVPLSQLAEVQEVVGPRQITREQNQRFITVQCNVRERDIGSFVAEGQRLLGERLSLPPGYLMTWGGQFRLQQEANKRLAMVIPITLLVLFTLLFSSFNSLKSTALILLNIPLALVGGIAALWLSGQNLSVPASVGFIALLGIALGNGMVMVSTMNNLNDAGKTADQTAIQGALRRVKPVLMTALTTALGLIPLLFSSGTGSEVQRPLAAVVVGGLGTSTLVTLLILPAVYKWFAPPAARGLSK